MRIQSLVGQHRVQRREHAEPLRPVQVRGKRMTDDAVAIFPSATRASLHLSRHARTNIAEKRPAGPHQGRFTLQGFARHSFLVDARKRKRDLPKGG